MAPAIDLIRRIGGDSNGSYTYYPVVVIGAGESGICMGCKLQTKLKCDQFRIFERRSGLGGTWYANRYPGIACDIPAIVYSYSFAQNSKWTTTYPTGKEIVSYLYDVCSDYKLLDKIQCDTNIKSVRWLAAEKEWELLIEHLTPGAGDMSTAERKNYEIDHPEKPVVLKTEKIRAKVVVSAVGGLVEPKAPIDLPGKEQFEGKILHTARWDESVDLKEKNVVVIGTGCSAAQVVSELNKPAYKAKHVTQIMRSPPWVTPFVSPEAKERWQRYMPVLCTYVPGFQKIVRKSIYSMVELEWYLLFAPTEEARQRRSVKRRELLDYMQKKVPAKYHTILTPDYEVFCKRRVIDDGWFAALQNPEIEITTRKPKTLKARHLTLGTELFYPMGESAPSGDEDVPCDILVMANGYQTNEWIHPLEVRGRDDQSLHEVWQAQGGAGAYLSLANHGFPNLFFVFGPNSATGHSSVILASENTSNYAINFIGPVLRGEIDTFEVKKDAEATYTAELQQQLKKSVFNSGGAKNWYVTEGWNSTTYPRSQIDFWLRCQFPRYGHWNLIYTTKGLIRLWLTRSFRIGILLVLLASCRYGLQRGFKASFDQLRLGLINMGGQAISRLQQRLSFKAV